jgi:hypothetical protein
LRNNKTGESSMKISLVFTIFFIFMILSGLAVTTTCWAAPADEIDAKLNFL